MVDRELLLQAEHWHNRALQTRIMARNAKEAENRQRLLKVARGYDRLAARVEEWKAAREKQQDLMPWPSGCSKL
jgi:hypothetical protein